MKKLQKKKKKADLHKKARKFRFGEDEGRLWRAWV